MAAMSIIASTNVLRRSWSLAGFIGRKVLSLKGRNKALEYNVSDETNLVERKTPTPEEWVFILNNFSSA